MSIDERYSGRGLGYSGECNINASGGMPIGERIVNQGREAKLDGSAESPSCSSG
jgi:hypothetical protein